jgi:pyruvate/2-oxoglutarate dehydrogenase complex dihydrolipoamide acyltransferase (E2) component
VRIRLTALLVLVAIAGCGGDDEGGEPATQPAAPTTAAAPPATAPAQPQQREEPKPPVEKRERTPTALAECIREQDGVEEALVKGRDSEDATFFEDLVGGRVDVLGVTLEGVSGEVSVFLFESDADAAKAVPSAGGGGVEAKADGRAVVAAPAGADAAPVSSCLAATGYS